MLGNSLNDLSKFYGGNSFSQKSLRVSHIEKGENSSERICHSNGSSSMHHKNLNDKKMDMQSALKKSNDENGTKVSSSPNFLNPSHQSKKFLDTLNDKNMCHYIFQQHLNQKSQLSYEKIDLKSKDKNTIKTSTSDPKHRDNLYPSNSSYQYSHLLSKNPIDPTYQMKMPPPMHANMPAIPSPPSNFGAKQLSKLKRFLTTLQQFAIDISSETGERVRTLVLNLVNSVISIEEFHSKLQEATNFPLRPFVIPFLRANLPLLQYELLNFTRLSKLNTSEYLNQSIENFLFNDNSLQNNPSPTEYPGGEILNNKLKRKSPDNESIIQSSNKKYGQNVPLLYISSPNSGSGSLQNQGLPAPPPIRPRPSPPHHHIPQIPIQHPPGVHFPVVNLPKQSFANHIPNFMNSHISNSSSPKNFFPVSNSFYPNHHSSNCLTNSTFNPSSSQPNQLYINPTVNQAGLLITNQMNGKNLSKHDDNNLGGKDKNFNYYMKEFEQDFNDALSMDVNIDFKNIDSMLNSIFEMVEKTQKILDTVHSKAQKLKKQKVFYENELKRIAEANEESLNINESKKNSNKDDMIILKNDQRTPEQLNKEIEKCDGHLKESNQDENISEKCWNCGRRGVETCSKCSQTKFCSLFCKNKHFEIKHYKQFDLESVKIEVLDEKENEIVNDLLSDDNLIEKQEKKKSKEEEQSLKNVGSNSKNQQDNMEIKE